MIWLLFIACSGNKVNDNQCSENEIADYQQYCVQLGGSFSLTSSASEKESCAVDATTNSLSADATVYCEIVGDSQCEFVCKDVPLPPEKIDDDRDGFSEENGDCDDNDGSIYPGAVLEAVNLECMLDLDGDGYGDKSPPPAYDAGTDCDDTTPFIYPGSVAEANLEQCMLDADGDGYGDISPANPLYDPGTDCDDDDQEIYPGSVAEALNLECMIDADGDGYGDNSPSPEFDAGTDCNDEESSIFPGATLDALNNECMLDADGDGFGAQEPGFGYDAGSDCNDSDVMTFPGAAELESPLLCMNDSDDDGWGDKNVADGVSAGTDCDDDDPIVFPGAVAEALDLECMFDADGDGFGDNNPSTDFDPGTDCNDSDANLYPTAVDWVGDQIDQNCDGIDGVDTDFDGYASISSGGDDCDDTDPLFNNDDIDSDGYTTCNNDCDDTDPLLTPLDADNDTFSTCTGDCDDSDDTFFPYAIDNYGDGIDQNCDGADGVDSDGDGYANFVSGGDDCDDTDNTVNPNGSDSYGDGVDQNCDGADGVDSDNDGYASIASGGDDCDDTNAILFPDDVDGDGTSSCDGDCSPYVGYLYPYDEDGDGSPDGCGWKDVVIMNSDRVCGFDSDDQFQCWGGTLDFPEYTQTFLEMDEACGIDENNEIQCWDGSIPPAGDFLTVDTNHVTCAIDTNGKLHCWELSYWGDTSTAFEPESVCYTAELYDSGRYLEYYPGYWDYFGFDWLGELSFYMDGSYLGSADKSSWSSTPETVEVCINSGTQLEVKYTCVHSGYIGNNRCSQESYKLYDSDGNQIDSQSFSTTSYNGITVYSGSTVYGGYDLETFTDVAVSETDGFCAITTAGTIDCHNYIWYYTPDKFNPPSGTFSSIEMGSDHGCALKASGVVECWGSNSYDQSLPPPAYFSSITSDGEYCNCGITTDDEIACWGSSSVNSCEAPEGSYSKISMTRNNWCAISLDGDMECWQSDYYHKAIIPPKATYNSFIANQSNSGFCYQYEDGAFQCLGLYEDEISDDLSALEVGRGFACGINSSGAVECYGDDTHGQSTPPQGVYSDLSLNSSYYSHGCAIEVGGNIQCWGYYSASQTPPAGTFQTVEVGDDHSCALDQTGAIQCWGNDSDGQSTPPSGTFVELAVGYKSSCGLDVFGAISCWGDVDAPPNGTFVQVAAISGTSQYSKGIFCSLNTLGQIGCWGQSQSYNGNSLDDYGEIPSGTFELLQFNGNNPCAIDCGGGVQCWGDNNSQYEMRLLGGDYCADALPQELPWIWFLMLFDGKSMMSTLLKRHWHWCMKNCSSFTAFLSPLRTTWRL